MKRDIKFRAWNAKDSLMSDPFDIFRGTCIWRSKHESATTFASVFPNYQVMQFTGLQDKNGVDIYEGDVVEFDKNGKGDIPDFGLHIVRKTPVYWNDFRASWSVKFSDMANNDLFKYHLMCEVIGNIYENPELVSSSEIPTEKQNETLS